MAARRVAYVVGTFDTKGDEHRYVAALIRAAGLSVLTVDIGTRSDARDVDVAAAELAAHHPGGRAAVLEAGDRGVAVTAMTEALRRWMETRFDVGGMITLAGSGGTAIVAPAMRSLPVGTPKILVSTLAAGDMSPYTGIHDVTTMFPVHGRGRAEPDFPRRAWQCRPCARRDDAAAPARSGGRQAVPRDHDVRSYDALRYGGCRGTLGHFRLPSLSRKRFRWPCP
jgi:hypothetical protein